MSGKGSIARKKAIKLDVEAWIRYAVYSEDHTNPYAVDDKRHDLFAASLHREKCMSLDFADMCDAYGDDIQKYKKRPYDRPKLL